MAAFLTLEEFLADNQLSQALASLRAFGSNTPADVQALKDEDVAKMLQQEQSPLKKLVGKKLKICLCEWRMDALDMTVPAPVGKPGKEPPKDFKIGLEAADYVSKWYRCQLVGFGFSGQGGVNQFGHYIKQSLPVPPGGCRILVHFEGWEPKWDEYLVLPNEAKRLRSKSSQADGEMMGSSFAPIARLGNVHGLKVRTAQGAVVNAAATAIVLKDERNDNLDKWEGLELMILLQFEGGGQEWIDLSQEEGRNRFIGGHSFQYPSEQNTGGTSLFG